jgi:hypothetical protein
MVLTANVITCLRENNTFSLGIMVLIANVITCLRENNTPSMNLRAKYLRLPSFYARKYFSQSIFPADGLNVQHGMSVT